MLRYCCCLAAVCGAVLASAPAGAQGGWHFGSGQPDLLFVSGTVRLVRDGRTVRHLERPGPVWIEATIQNGGPGVARDVVVRAEDNGKVIAEPTIPILVGGGTYDLRIGWLARRGPHKLTITLDPGNQIRESNENNNLATIEAPVPRLLWPLAGLIVVLAVVAGAVAFYASWRLWSRPAPTRRGPPEKPPDQSAPE